MNVEYAREVVQKQTVEIDVYDYDITGLREKHEGRCSKWEDCFNLKLLWPRIYGEKTRKLLKAMKLRHLYLWQDTRRLE